MLRPDNPAQTPEKRLSNFAEVTGGISKKQAVDEANRCPQCSEPTCIEGCPLKIDIPSFIRSIREGQLQEALRKIREKNCLTAVCGRTCSAPCEKACVFNEATEPISIRALERYTWDHAFRWPSKKKRKKEDKIKVAIIGSGPAGLVAAAELAKGGYQVTVFESLHLVGGILRYGIPSFRLPEKILDSEVAYIQSLGVEFETNVCVGQTYSFSEIFEKGFSAILLSLGAGVSKSAHIPGEYLSGVYFAEEFLIRVNLMKAYQYPSYSTSPCVGKKVVVIGGGNAALDCARIAVRLGRESKLVYHGTEDELKVESQEREYAKQEGVALEVLTKPLELLSDDDGRVRGVRCLRLDFADPNCNGKWQLIPVDGSEFDIEADSVIIAVGNKSNVALLQREKDLRINKNRAIWMHKNSHMTSIPGVFVAGALSLGTGPAVHSMGNGKEVAVEINRYLKEHIVKK